MFQTRTHQLLVQNKELLEHIGALVSHLREQDRFQGFHDTTLVHNPQSVSGTGNLSQGPPTISDVSNSGQVTLYRMTP